ncbi:glycosyltransferase [Marinitoga sp. 1138]|uniref:GumK N-terminal domain-containing glycosyltransferase n=1 Tax=Marinitoga sp. 1138 TaxID=1643334 RepID=UPI001586E131|nr:glycosyltransferase [Marinitoga sp. 1138]NUU97735.1 hypothetical protein [Marinitoga sp. 1138]
MKKVLIVSSIPYSNSNRGIEILSEAFKLKKYKVDYLVFPGILNKEFLKYLNIAKQHNITLKNCSYNILGYYERIMKNFPKNITRFFINLSTRKVKNINFNEYKYIVLESGKPIFLSKFINDKSKIIYRQSDSLKYILSKNRLLWSMEKEIIKEAYKIIVVRKVFKEMLPEKYKAKTTIIVNGFNIPKEIVYNNPYSKGTFNAVYIGYTPLDYETIEYICKNNKNINIHIIGKGLSRNEIKKLSKKYDNFYHHGILSSYEYNNFLKFSDVAIVPYSLKYSPIEYIGLNSKYLNFMYYSLPIISYRVGQLEEFNGLPVHFVDSKKEFLNKLNFLFENRRKIKYKIDFNYFSKQGRLKEYITFIENL